ncbi:MAG: hypothetical protein NXI32_28165 [bacterium]|nr:hypothetical protein [bacterium]
MLSPFWQYEIPLWTVGVLFACLLLFPMEIGFRLGARARRVHPDPDALSKRDITLTAMLTLLALMLAFTYSFSMSRADLRKAAFINEVNAISTAFLRSDLLSEPGRTHVRQQLYAYAQSRYVEPGKITTLQAVQQFVAESLAIQAGIWPAVKQAIRQEGTMTDPEKALLIAATNDVLDTHTSRLAVFFDRLPMSVLALLVLIAGTSLGFAAHNGSVGGYQMRLRLTAFALVLACLMYTILDFDMMFRGFIQVDQASLVDLIAEMNASME